MINGFSALAPTIGQIGLQIGIGPASLWLNGIVSSVPFGFVFLAPNSTSYVYLNTTTGLINVNTTGVATNNIPIATVVTSLTKVVTLVDNRPDYTNVGGGGGSAGAAVWSTVSTSQTVVATSFNQSLNASGNITLALTPQNGQTYTVVNTGSGLVILQDLSSNILYELVNTGQGVTLSYDYNTTTWRVTGSYK
jgi:hypothetical protein